MPAHFSLRYTPQNVLFFRISPYESVKENQCVSKDLKIKNQELRIKKICLGKRLARHIFLILNS